MPLFPYTNSQELNLDWILQVVKDFQTKYTNFDQTLADALAAIETAKDGSLEDMQTALENALTAINEAITNIESAERTALNHIQQMKVLAVNSVTSAEEHALQNISNDLTAALASLQTSLTTALNTLTTAQTDAATVINNLYNTLPSSDRQILGRLSILNALITGAPYPDMTWIQGSYIYPIGETPPTPPTPNTDEPFYSTTVCLRYIEGAAGMRIRVQTDSSFLIKYLLVWRNTPPGGQTYGFLPSEIGGNDHYIDFVLPLDITAFTIEVNNQNPNTPITPSDLAGHVTVQWITDFVNQAVVAPKESSLTADVARNAGECFFWEGVLYKATDDIAVGDTIVLSGPGANCEETSISNEVTNNIPPAVNAWLTAHPEATTTVQDHSLTYEKLVNGTLGYVTPEMYGAVGDGVTDDTDAINAALSSGAKMIVFTKNYAIKTSDNDSEYGHDGLGIVAQSNTTLLFMKSKLIGIPNNARRYSVLKLDGVSNVSVIGAEIQCDKTLNAGEHGFGIQVRNSNHILIDNCVVYNALGDCLIVGSHADGTELEENTTISSDVVISNCEFYGARRQGITIGGANRVLVDNCYIHDISGVAPQSGIDIEPNYSTTQCNDIVIRNTRIKNTVGASLNISNCTNDTGLIIEGCYFDNMLYCAAGFLLVNGSVLKHINFNNNSTPLHVVSNCRLLGYMNFEQNAKIINCYLNPPSDVQASNVLFAGEYANNVEAVFENCVLINTCKCNFSRGKLILKNCDVSLTVDYTLISNGKVDFENCSIDIQNSYNSQVINCTEMNMIGCYVKYNCPSLLWINDSAFVGKFMKNILIASVNNTLNLRGSHAIDNIVSTGTTIQTTGTNQGNITF